jgi:hypothetical protein
VSNHSKVALQKFTMQPLSAFISFCLLNDGFGDSNIAYRTMAPLETNLTFCMGLHRLCLMQIRSSIAMAKNLASV